MTKKIAKVGRPPIKKKDKRVTKCFSLSPTTVKAMSKYLKVATDLDASHLVENALVRFIPSKHFDE